MYIYIGIEAARNNKTPLIRAYDVFDGRKGYFFKNMLYIMHPTPPRHHKNAENAKEETTNFIQFLYDDERTNARAAPWKETNIMEKKKDEIPWRSIDDKHRCRAKKKLSNIFAHAFSELVVWDRLYAFVSSYVFPNTIFAFNYDPHTHILCVSCMYYT